MISAVLVGRAGCGWVCPMGLYQRSVGAIPTKKAKISKPDNKDLNGIGGFLMALFLLIAFGIGFMNLTNLGNAFIRMPYTPFDPAATLFGSIFYFAKFGILESKLILLPSLVILLLSGYSIWFWPFHHW